MVKQKGGVGVFNKHPIEKVALPLLKSTFLNNVEA